MHKTKLPAFAAVAVLLAAVLSNVAGQNTRNSSTILESPVAINGPDLSKVKATELSPGETNFPAETVYGATYHGQTSNDVSGSVFMSVNYTLAGTTVLDARDSIINPPEPINQISKITGGSWTRLIFKNGTYIGSVYGRITGGKIVWSPTNLSATVSLELAVDNGTEAFVDRTGKGTFEGTLDRMDKVASLFGLLTLEY